jgi:mono/diheme cytochrome c family protein
MRMIAILSALAGLPFAGLACTGCARSGAQAAAERGRQVYMTYCVACHNADPASPGAAGPEVAGASRELLEARVVHGTYPPGYTPKRPTKAMTPLPFLAPKIDDLAAFLAAPANAKRALTTEFLAFNRWGGWSSASEDETARDAALRSRAPVQEGPWT